MSEAFECDHCNEVCLGRPAAQASVGEPDSPRGVVVDFCESCSQDIQERWGISLTEEDDE